MLRCNKSVREFVLGELNSVRRVIVVSPWLSRETVELLGRLNRAGSDVVLITTDDVENRNHAEALELLQGLTRETKASPGGWFLNSSFVSILKVHTRRGTR
jgi:predicted transcriptional regulator